MIKLAPRNKGDLLTDLVHSERLEKQRFCRLRSQPPTHGEGKNGGQMNSLIPYYEFFNPRCAKLVQWLVVGKGIPSLMLSVVCGLLPYTCPRCLHSLKELLLRRSSM